MITDYHSMLECVPLANFLGIFKQRKIENLRLLVVN